MIKIGDNFYRNLEEQVQKNKEDIAAHYNIDRVLADFGIRVLGQKANADLLPDPETFKGEYGDAYAVGEAAPYSFYIWTRANPDDGHPNDYWFDIGQLGIIGPQGPIGLTGPQGPQGERGSIWISGNGVPSNTSGYQINDKYMNNTNGDVYTLTSTNGTLQWTLSSNIKGPQGLRGPQGERGLQGEQGPIGKTGERGPAGPIVNILGTLSSVDQLPNPSTVSRQAGYIVTVGGVNHVYIIVGSGSNLSWFDAGQFGVGTLIKDGGTILSEWDATNVMAPRLGNVPNYTGFAYQESDGSAELVRPDPTADPLGIEYNYPVDSVRPVTRFPNGGVVAATSQYTYDISDIAYRLAIDPETEEIDVYPHDNPYDESYHTGIRDDQATPRVYVDAMDYQTFNRASMYTDRTAIQKPLSNLPIEELNSLLRLAGPGIPVLKAADYATNVVETTLKEFKVKCNIIDRGMKDFTLRADKFYVIHGFGRNRVTLFKGYGDNKTPLLSNKNDIIAMISSNGTPDGGNKTWCGFLAIESGSLGVPAINWYGDLLEPEMYVENVSPESDGGSGNMYVYEFGMFDYNQPPKDPWN